MPGACAGLLGLCFAVSLNAFGAPQSRPAWTLTVEERLALRFDPRLIAERARVHAQSSEGGVRKPPFVIDGRRNPELFLPHEVMTTLLEVNFGDERARASARNSYADAVRRLEWEEAEFWTDLSSAAAGYFRLLDEHPGPERSDDVERQICAGRAEALRAMRARYGRFDEFLYREVAPRGVFFGDRAPTRERLLYFEGGCR